MFGDCLAYIPRLVADHRWIFAEHFSWQNIANGSWKISKQALKILGIGEMLPHEYHEFRLFREGSVIPPEHRLMLVNFHRECIGDAKKAQWDRGIKHIVEHYQQMHYPVIVHFLIYMLLYTCTSFNLIRLTFMIMFNCKLLELRSSVIWSPCSWWEHCAHELYTNRWPFHCCHYCLVPYC